jgi:DNA/RNA endonuclease G (NUC1)
MNKIFLTAVLFLGLSITAFGQEKTKTALTKGKAEILKGKESGNFSFTLPSGTATSTVEQNAKAYTMYFKVNFNESTHEAAITMVNNDEKSRHVICRF